MFFAGGNTTKTAGGVAAIIASPIRGHWAGRFSKKHGARRACRPHLDDLFLQKIRDFVGAKLDDPEFGNLELAREMFLSEC